MNHRWEDRASGWACTRCRMRIRYGHQGDRGGMREEASIDGGKTWKRLARGKRPPCKGGEYGRVD